MRQLWIATLSLVTAAALGTGSAQAGKVEMKNVHLCCAQCVKAVAKVLSGVEGVSDAKCDQKGKTVTFTAKDTKLATAGVKALYDAGFYGPATEDGKEIKVDVASPKKGDKADEITVKNVHVCCKQCQNAINGLFKDSKVEYPGKGEVKVSGKGVEKAQVLETLRKAGFNGTIE